ncbi:MAG: hypothetical protein DRH37_00725 [Deltaproteobacteria bacterium]|nr:MAG: hypothetical protein DRH37_00725 [Deltaproteobacteria bacterium]
MGANDLSLLERIEKVREESSFEKDSKIDTGKGSYDIRTENSVLKTLRPLFKKYRMLPVRESIDVVYSDAKTVKIVAHMVMYDLNDESEPIRFSGIGSGFDKVDKDSGKASTYAVKDAYLKLFIAVSGLDSDADGSDYTDGEVRGSAKALLDKLWEKGHFHFKAAKLKGIDPEKTEGWMDQVDSDARVYYQKGVTRISEGGITDVANDIHTMQELLKK